MAGQPQPSDRMRDVLEEFLAQPTPPDPIRVRGDGVLEYGELDQPEHIEGIDPATGKRDGRFDGTITAAAPLTLVADGLHPQLPPEGHPAYQGALMVPVPGQMSDLVIAQSMDALEGLVAYDPRRIAP